MTALPLVLLSAVLLTHGQVGDQPWMTVLGAALVALIAVSQVVARRRVRRTLEWQFLQEGHDVDEARRRAKRVLVEWLS